jgi:hypothetical protein
VRKPQDWSYFSDIEIFSKYLFLIDERTSLFPRRLRRQLIKHQGVSVKMRKNPQSQKSLVTEDLDFGNTKSFGGISVRVLNLETVITKLVEDGFEKGYS